MRPNPFHSKPSLLIAATALAFATAPLAATTAAPADPPASGSTPPTASGKIKVTTADDLPRHTYAISGKTLDILNDPAKFDPIVDKLIADALRDLETYDISDPTTLQAYYELLSQAYMLRMDLPRALEWSNRAGTLDDKPQERATRGNMLGALAAAREVSTDMSSPQFIAKFKQSLKERVSAQPYDLVKDQLIGMRSQAKMITRELVESSLSGQLDTLIAAANGQATAGIAESIMGAKITLDIALPLLPHMASVYGEIIDANANAVKASSKWDTRLVELEPSSSATPVVLGVWDSGVDVGLYAKQLWQNPAESPNGLDDDRNGFVDDVHGIAFGLDRLPTTGSLCSLDGLKGSKDLYMDFIAASQDMQAGVQNESVTRFQEYFSALRGKDLENFSDDMGLIGNYAHGTHVAGVAVAGNPFARILHIAENWPWKSIPDEAPTIEFGERWGEACRQSVTYMKGANTRVVNMSWRIGRPMLEGMLAAKGVGATPEERAELSRRIFKPFRDGLEEAIRSAPDVLFIAGSGNEDNNVDFAEYVPAGLRLPNLITVGAVDDQDQFTSFTTTGENVELYANGFRIPSMVPGGRVIPFSGTSMAAPQVANLAAKILALRPELKPADVIALMKANADPIPNKPGRFIINPKRTIEALQAQK
jgi:subtilisin family serine protease